MKELCQCDCSHSAPYKTPWCDLLHNGKSGEVLHLWYKLDWLRREIRNRLAYLGNTQNYDNAPNVSDLVGSMESSMAEPMRFHLSYAQSELTKEINRRTAYLGKFRRTDQAQHLLDLIAMTEDEHDLFVSFVQEAMTDVWAVLSLPFVGIDKKAWWQASDTTEYAAGVHFDFDVEYRMTEENLAPLRTSILEALVLRVIYKWLILSYPSEAAAYDTLFQQSLITVRNRSNEFKALWSELFIPFSKAAMADVYDALVMYSPKPEKAYFWNEGTQTIVFDDPDPIEEGTVDEEGYMYLPSIQKMDAQGYVPLNITIDSEGYASFNAVPPVVVEFKKGDYVLYNENLYRAIADGDSTDVIGKLEPTEDYRESIHYGIKWTCGKSNMNMIDPLDTAIFEALTTRIIYKWLKDAYPTEAPRYLDEWNDNLALIRTRVRFLEGAVIVNRIPRSF